MRKVSVPKRSSSSSHQKQEMLKILLTEWDAKFVGVEDDARCRAWKTLI